MSEINIHSSSNEPVATFEKEVKKAVENHWKANPDQISTKLDVCGLNCHVVKTGENEFNVDVSGTYQAPEAKKTAPAKKVATAQKVPAKKSATSKARQSAKGKKASKSSKKK